MEKIRKIVELGHSLRDEAGIKLRQPLAEFEIEKLALKNADELLPILAEELNVKICRIASKIEDRHGWITKNAAGENVALRTEITEELKREGWVRELSRQINDLRKEAKLTPADRITLSLVTDDIEFKSILTTEKEHLAAAARADEVVFDDIKSKFARDLDLEGKKVEVKISKR